jgi:putative transposase
VPKGTLANWVKAAKRGSTGSTSAPGSRSVADLEAQYCAHGYRKLLDQFGMQASMSRKGNCFDKAPMEAFGAA